MLSNGRAESVERRRDNCGAAALVNGEEEGSSKTFAAACLTSEAAMAVEASDGVALAKFVSLGLIIALGSAGNVLVIYAFSRNFQLRRSPFLLMVGFVSADLVRVFVCFPITLVTVMHKLQWKYGPELCQLMAFANVLCLLGNSLTVLGMATDRYVATRYRHFHQRNTRRGLFACALLLAVWGLAFLFAFPAVYGLGSYQYLPAEAQCTFPHHHYQTDMDTLSLLLSLTGVTLLTQLVYARLFMYLRGRRRMRPVLYEPAVSEDWSFFGPGATRNLARNQWLVSSLSSSAAPLPTIGRNVLNLVPQDSRVLAVHLESLQERPSLKREESLTKTCFAVNLAFTAMWLPYVIVCFVHALKPKPPGSQLQNVVPPWLEVGAAWMTYLQVAVTPLAFFSVAGFARRALLKKRLSHRNAPACGSAASAAEQQLMVGS